MKKFTTFLILTSSLPLLSNESSYMYLDCGDETHLLLRVLPEASLETLDNNLKWRRDRTQIINLDTYVTIGEAGYYQITRDTLRLKIMNKYSFDSEIFECFTTSKEKVDEEINLIKTKKKSKQKI